MVRVLSCHHFAYQEVFTTQHEPNILYTTADTAFLTTSQCYIEAHSLTERECPMVARFPTIAPVKQLAYSKLDNFIATIEEGQSEEENDALRVYVNWQGDNSGQPMRVRISGHMTSIRHSEAISSRFEVIEIPLKSQPNCLTTNLATGVLVVGVEQSVLFYGLCQKVIAADSSATYRDMKCLLELSFTFPVRQVAVCEEFVACSSYSEFQVVQLKGKGSAFLKPLSECSSPLKDDLKDESKKNVDLVLLDQIHSLRQNSLPRAYSPSLSAMSDVSSHSTDERCHDYIIQDENFIEWDFELRDPEHYKEFPLHAKEKSKKKQAKTASTNLFSAASAKASGFLTPLGERAKGFFTPTAERRAGFFTPIEEKKTITFPDPKKTATREQKLLHRELKKTGVMYGPIENPLDCDVSVEYEDVCKPGDPKQGYLTNGVVTFLYKKFESEPEELHSLQLRPIYSPVLCESETNEEESCDNCSCWWNSHRRSRLVGMYCFLSLPQEGRLYQVSGKARLLASYPYTATCTQACVSENMIYAVTEQGVEVYSSRCLLSALHEVDTVEEALCTLPPVNLDICLLGRQPFIGPEAIGLSDNMVVIISKHITDTDGDSSDGEERNWSVYALKTPFVNSLYHDMVSLIKEYEEMKIPTTDIMHLLLETFVVLQGHQFQQGHDPAIHQFERSIALKIAEIYAQPGHENPTKALPYYSSSGLGVEEIVQRARDKVQFCGSEYGVGLLHYLDYILFLNKEPLNINKKDGLKILKVYMEMQPHRLSTVLLKSRLKTYDCSEAMGLLDAWMTSPGAEYNKSLLQLDQLAKVELYLEMGNVMEAEIALSVLNKKELVECCIKHHHVLHVGFNSLSPIAQLLRRHNQSVFLKIMVSILDREICSLDTVLHLLQGPDGRETMPQTDVMQLLEKVLSDKKRQSLFPEAARQLLDIYMRNISGTSQSAPTKHISPTELIPRGKGSHFGKRHSWLNDIAPLQGEAALWRCQYLMVQRVNMNQSAPPGFAPIRNNTLMNGPCPCGTCNASLVKLQSLLCSRHATSFLFKHVLEELEQAEVTIRGRDSLWLLATSREKPKAALDFVLMKYPTILPPLCADVSRKIEDMWSYTITCLLEVIRCTQVSQGQGQSSSLTQQQLYNNVFKDLLSLTADEKSPDEFVQLLPPDGSATFFLPYIEQSYRSHGAQHLRNIIINKANALNTIR